MKTKRILKIMEYTLYTITALAVIIFFAVFFSALNEPPLDHPMSYGTDYSIVYDEPLTDWVTIFQKTLEQAKLHRPEAVLVTVNIDYDTKEAIDADRSIISEKYRIPYVSKEKPAGSVNLTYDKVNSTIIGLGIIYHYDKDKDLPGLTPENASEIIDVLYQYYVDMGIEDAILLSFTINVDYLHSEASVSMQREDESWHGETFELEEGNGYFTIKEDL